MKFIFVAAMLAACGTNDPGPHDLGACGSGWQAYNGNGTDFFVGKSCERACEQPPANYLSTTAPTCTVQGAAVSSCAYFADTDGTLGCCVLKGTTTAVAFYECDPQP